MVLFFPVSEQLNKAMNRLLEKKQDLLLKELVENKKPLLGICLGCQILLEKSSENNTKTLRYYQRYL